MARGGKRNGAGRKSLVSNKKAINITLSSETREIVKKYANDLGLSRSDFIDRFLFLYIEQCPDFIYCKNCHEPILWSAIHNVATGKCLIECSNCNQINEIDFD